MQPSTPLLFIFFIFSAFLAQRQSLYKVQKYHHQAPTFVKDYSIGKLKAIPLTNDLNKQATINSLLSPIYSILSSLAEKRIYNFIWVSKEYKFEIALIYLNYISVVIVSFYDPQSQALQLKKQYYLPSPLEMTISTPQFNLSLKDLGNSKYSFKGGIIKNNIQISFDGSLTVLHQNCIQMLRHQVMSYKCFNGNGEMQLQIQHPHSSMHHYQLHAAQTILDVLIGSGFHWNWVWGIALGYSQDVKIALNMGSLFKIQEDFLIIDNVVTPVHDLSYSFSDDQNTAISVKSAIINATFKPTAKTHNLRDVLILKNDQIKWDGRWKGKVLHKGNIISFQGIGLIENAKSCF